MWQFILSPWTGGQAVPGYLTPTLVIFTPLGASCPGRFILPPTHTGAIILSDVFNLFAIYYDINMFFCSYKDVFQSNEYQLFKWFTFVRGVGGGANCSGWFILSPPPPPGFVLVRGVGGKLSRLVHWNSGRGGGGKINGPTQLAPTPCQYGGKLSRLVYHSPRPEFGSNSVIS